MGREATPSGTMELGIQLQMAGLSLSNTVSIFELFYVDRHRTTVQMLMNMADLQPEDAY